MDTILKIARRFMTKAWKTVSSPCSAAPEGRLKVATADTLASGGRSPTDPTMKIFNYPRH